MVTVNSRTVFGGVFAAIGLIIFLIVVLIALEVALGMIPALTVSDQSIGSGNQVLFGIVLQTSMFVILIVVAFILMRFGIDLVLHKEKQQPKNS